MRAKSKSRCYNKFNEWQLYGGSASADSTSNAKSTASSYNPIWL